MTELADTQKKRKLQDGPEIEIDVSAPEPQSKKALRKAKKHKAEGTDTEKTKANKTESTETESQAPEKRSDYGIWIGNLSFSVTKDDLRRFLTSNCSFADTTITRIHLPKGVEKYGRPQNKGFAYVDFSTQAALQGALGLSEHLLTGRRVLIKNAKSFEGRPEKSRDQGDNAAGSAAKPGHAPSRRIFVGNLGFDVSKEAMEEHFGQCGTLANVHMATFQDTGKCKGYAWVEFEDLAAAEAAVRGFTMVDEEDEESDDSSSDSDSSDSAARKQTKPKKPRQRRVWVNQLMGRRMRMEFAEDPTTRYKKRFGKDSEEKRKDHSTEANDIADDSGYQPQARKTKQPIDESRYSKQTVQKLSGAIVESHGRKTTFD